MTASLIIKNKKNITRVVFILLLVFACIIVFNLFRSFMVKRFFAHYEPPALAVSSVTAVAKQWIHPIAAVGNFTAINGVEVNSQTSGKVTAIRFESGQFIDKDSPLIDIDDTIELTTLKFDLANLTLQDLNFKRQSDLLKRNAASSSTVDEAQARLLQAQANVEKTQAQINQKHIRAPFTGRLGIRQIDLGQYITPGQTGIVTLQSMDPLFLKFYLPEEMLNRLKINQNITFSVEQNPNLRFEGKITAINSRIDVNTHTIEVQATLPNCPTAALKDPVHSNLVTVKNQEEGRAPIIHCDTGLNIQNKVTEFNFIPGMFASIEIEQPSIPGVIVLPSTAISYTLYGNSVFIIEKDSSPDEKGEAVFRVKRVFVSTGQQQGNFTMINKGIKPGQIVVASGELKLQDGTRVKINNDIPLNTLNNPLSMGQ